ncbi:MAG: S8 family serine peptidase [Paramuribaculum sp.]|nr:S8 family serine peptidase [Paramuribaculum sp.]
MMRFFVAAVAALLAGSAWAQFKISPAGMRVVSEAKASRGDVARSVVGFVSLAEGQAAEDLEGVRQVYGVENGVALVEFALGDAEIIAAQPGVKRLSFGNVLRPALDKAREASMVSYVQTDPLKELGATFDGRGVVVGLVDHGLDPNNVNFMDQTTEKSRVKRVWNLGMDDDNEGTAVEYATEESIANFTTDNAGATHGTHVAGIMAGSYNGAGEIVELGSSGWVKTQGSVPYYGVATGADLAMAGGSLAEPAVVLGVQKIVDYAAEVGKPSVVNLSLGTTMGPHDGTDAFSRYMAGLGMRSVICISAGNEGEQNVSLQYRFEGASSELKTFLKGYSGKAGVADAWGKNSTPFDATFVLFDKNTRRVVYSEKVEGKASGSWVIIGTENRTDKGWKHNAYFDQAFEDSFVQIYCENCTDNNRFNIYTYYDLTNKSTNVNLVPGLIYSGKAGTEIDVWDFCDGGEFTSDGVEGWSDGNASESINGMACGANVIVVGSYISRDKWPVLGGGQMWYGEAYNSAHPVGTVSPFTSYGATFQGRKLPDFCAPGEGIVSSYSTYYVDIEDADIDQMSAEAESSVNGKDRKNYWHVMQGTSMASPYVAGIAALMLQAKPSLGVSDVKDLLRRTAHAETGRNETEAKQWGAGKVDAFVAMCELLGKSSALSVLDDTTRERLKLGLSGSRLSVMMDGEESVAATLYGLNGAAVASATGGADGTVIQTGGAGRGVYIVVARGKSGLVVTEKVVIE